METFGSTIFSLNATDIYWFIADIVPFKRGAGLKSSCFPVPHFFMSSVFVQLQLQFMTLLQLLNLLLAFGCQFLELIDIFLHYGQGFLLVSADGI